MQRTNSLLNRLLQIAVTAYQAVTIAAFLMAILFAITWLKIPFIGILTEPTLVANGATATGAEPWDLYNQGVRAGDQIIGVKNTSVSSAQEIMELLKSNYGGENIPVTVRKSDGTIAEFNVHLGYLPNADIMAYFVIPLVIGFFFLIISLWTFGLRRSEQAGRSFGLFASSLSIVTTTFFDLYTTHYLAYLWTAAAAIAGGALIDLALSFPREVRFVVGRPYLRWIGMYVSVGLFLYAMPAIFDLEHPTAYYLPWRYIYLFVGVAVLIFLGMNLFHRFSAPSPVVRAQTHTILIGTMAGLGPITLWLVTTPLHLFEFSPYLFLPIIFFPASIGYTILRFRFLRTDEWVRSGLVYGFLTVIVVVAYGLIASAMSMLLTASMPWSNIWVGVFVFLVVLLLEPLRNRLRNLLDTTFFRGQRVYAEQISQFSHELTTALDLNKISGYLREQINAVFAPELFHIYTYDKANDQFAALPGEDGRPTSDICFGSNSPLARYFAREHLPLYLDGSSLPPMLDPEKSRLALLNARLFLALPGKGEIPTGWLALGSRRSGQPYTPQDLTFLENISDQASIGIERVQTVADLERRILETDALVRVSQGVNITLTFDDVLELIYAQTSQIVPVNHLHITLYNKENNFYYYGFCVEDNERLQERENLPLPPNSGLAPEIVRKGRPILTQDYIRECQTRNATPSFDGIYAWIGVPLNAAAETIGVLSIGNRDTGITYTQSQSQLLQAIADQTAGAIVKARLLQETQQRAHQLSTLNEITRQLTGTLELEPLLQSMLESAVSILNSEAGGLFLVDEQTGELIFKVTVGPVAANLVGQRLPPGSGIVGHVVQTRRPIIENSAQQSPIRFDTDQQTGFVSRSILAVPLQAKGRVIGVVEVVNRRDGLPFVEEDQNLLTAFAGQASVAMENARLYTLTDQELANRVEELQVMQRIDRELNASLETDRAMHITLDWALRQSRAEAGLIGMLEEGKLSIMAEQGYEERPASLTEQVTHLHLPIIKTSMETGQPQRTSLPTSGQNRSLLPGAHTQISIPIRREATVIGLILLESTSDSQEDLAFLNRLSDHAAIAISNAQLYGEVQRANLAKSEFVSLVAHELKNPMTSIKGYSELLASGAVGGINDMQSNFLNTIRSNVERMSTLVSDLNDNSKIEAGRLRLDFKAMEVSDLVDEVLRSTKRQLDDKKQTVTLDLSAKLPAVWADRTRVGQVLTNLVSNAHKYTPESGIITLGAEETANLWDPEGAGRVIHLWVRDNGIGISAEDQAKIFQKFFRSDDSKAREAPGTGLGLNITKSLVEMQGGRIWFESEYRKGTTFHFTIPVAEG
jgi:signal transduction histidine kinase/putative methionine-R-sulfoxide reductase with GAF domain